MYYHIAALLSLNVAGALGGKALERIGEGRRGSQHKIVFFYELCLFQVYTLLNLKVRSNNGPQITLQLTFHDCGRNVYGRRTIEKVLLVTKRQLLR